MKILILDIETSQFLGKGGKILEIGIVSLDLLTGEKKILFDEVMHERPITREHLEAAWIMKNSSMTVEEIQHSVQLKHVHKIIQNIINDYPLGATAYNNTFDFGFLENRGFVFPRKLACPMKLSTDICKLPGKFGNYKWPNVEEAYKFFFPEVEFTELHRGADDAFHEADIVLELYRMGVFKVEEIKHIGKDEIDFPVNN